MRVPLLDLSAQYRELAPAILERIEHILSTQRFILGQEVQQFEEEICRYTGTPHAIGVSSGTDALLVVLMALGIGNGDAVITPAYSFFATAGCVVRVGARPVFVDVDPATMNISPAALEHFLNSECKRDGDRTVLRKTGDTVRALIPVHLFGLCCDMDAITDIAAEYHLEIIEDAAQAIGAEYPSRHGVKQAGTMGRFGCFSFYPTKNLGAAGDAGLVACGGASDAETIKRLRQHGMEPRYYHHEVGGAFRLDEIQAAILSVKLPHLDQWSRNRRAAAEFYRAQVAEAGLSDQVTLQAEPYRNADLKHHHIYHQFVIRVAERDRLRAHLAECEIGTEIYYPLGLHEQRCFANLGYAAADFPETQRIAQTSLALPVYPEISREAQAYVVESIAQFFR
jgi:dTDP-4-amino-4,6-dideoxygalactose transaminase